MIWALAGLGDEPRAITSVDTSEYYSPTTAQPIVGTVPPGLLPVRDENAHGPATPPVTAGIDMTMVVGVVAVVGVVGLMLSRGSMTANGKRRRGRKVGKNVRVMISSEHGPRKRVSQAQLRKEAKAAYAAISSAGGKSKKMKVWPGKGGRSGHWSVSGEVPRTSLPKIRSKMGGARYPYAFDVMKVR